eukprot:CAMPEP_0183720766 /NCGR_PEP_ID=MMETSP0737-20130205/13289_1 /TAXON_ID=385413 /ORGANISM="Thalassiosira miniscula, Strain CCMP1093" /LENGTH=590 /DNA_ID=CAMNT_0025950687 /DNA_START=15 /DNA_END=1787 /DNA_ORIENTATION=-
MAQANATQTFACALTGLSPLTDAVVTPSGYVCSRKLLLTKLSENGGVDPFDASGTRRLDESNLVELQSAAAGNNGVAAPPRPPKATSLPSLLGMLQNEFDAVLLELYDTRKALEETRRELSSALYQNDAAVRVVARVVRERDEARGKLEEFLANDQRMEATVAAPPAVVEPQKRGREEEGADEDVAAKKAKTDGEEGAEADLTKIPADELSAMNATWKKLSKGRKAIAKLKRSPEEIEKNEALLGALSEGNEKKVNLGKSSAKAGVLCMASVKSGDSEYVVTGGHDNTAIVYDVSSGKIVATLAGASGAVTAVHGMIVGDKMLVASGSLDGSIRVYSVTLNSDDEPSLLGNAKGSAEGTNPVEVTIHPSSTSDEARVLVASSEGSISLYKWSKSSGELDLLTRLEKEGAKLSSGCMHPDGLIYIAGTAEGELIVWDLKTQAVAGTLKGHDGNSIDCIAISENGYHVATSTASSPDSPVHVWDLRKLKLATTIATTDVGKVASVAFDPTASYLAYSGDGSAKVCVVKDWDRVVCTLNVPKSGGKKGKKEEEGLMGGIVWGGKGLSAEGEEKKVWLATGCDGQRPVRFWGVE